MSLLARIWREAARPRAAAPRVPEGVRVYAVGDIHGRADLLSRMVEAIAGDLAHDPVGEALLVLLGDYVDRGPDSKRVLDHLSTEALPAELVALRGNHEEMLLSFLDDPELGEAWRRNGGVEALHSYGVSVQEVIRGRGYAEAAKELSERIPETHLAFMRRLRGSFSIGNYFFCHAGVRPGVPLEEQSEADLLWIREEFLSSDADFGKVVVHGHTPVSAPEVRPNRIDIDTGAYITHRLTCLVLEGDEQRFILAAPNAKP